jgi:hypothetical protein
MTDRADRWYNSRRFVWMAQVLGILEMAGGLVLVVVKHDGAQGFALLGVGAATFGSMPWISRTR